jgi:hypothetical protein
VILSATLPRSIRPRSDSPRLPRQPGDTAFTVTPWRATSAAMGRSMAVMPPLEAVQTEYLFPPKSAISVMQEPVAMMRPHR